MKNILDLFNTLSIEISELLKGNNGKFIKQEYFKKILNKAYEENPWFTNKNVITTLKHISYLTTKNKIEEWLSSYKLKPTKKKVLVVMAGNIPLVSFHDMLSVLVSGNTFIGKLSSKDKVLPAFIRDILVEIDKNLKNKIYLTENPIKEFDAVIATGSDNSAKYFEKYFGSYPNIIRKNRSSIAIISGNETEKQLHSLADDIFLYFGLGCRNISKIYFPKGYDLNYFVKQINKTDYKSIITHNKYANNYSYNKAIYLMNKIPFIDGDFFILKEDNGITSPIGVIYYEYYKKNDNFDTKLLPLKEKIQIVLKSSNFGKAQFPELTEYADGIDVMNFLINL